MNQPKEIGSQLPNAEIKSLEIRSAKDLIKSVSKKSIRELSVISPAPMSVIKKQVGQVFVQSVIEHLIDEFVSSFNVGKNLDGDQLVECASLVYEEYYHYSVEHFKCAFDRFKMNKYPDIKIMDRIDVLIIFQILERFNGELMAARRRVEDDQRKQEFIEWDKAIKESVLTPEMEQKTKELLHSFTKKKEFAPFKQREQTEQDKILAEWSAEFRRIAPEPIPGLSRFANINGKMLNEVDYLRYRLEEYNKNNIDTKTK